MRLIIAEKPSVARAIADVLPKPQHRRGDYIECGDGTTVAWCAGHILEQAAPHEYDERFKHWELEHLPIVPRDWKLTVTSPDLYKTIKALLPRATRVVHAGDPDREGQLLVDEVLVHLAYRGPVDRLLVSDLNPSAIRKALDDLQPNTKFQTLYQAALARQRADWLFGLNMTRLYTLLGRAGGYDGVLSVGRVQTPVLGLVVRRDAEIDNFQPKPYFVLAAKLRGQHGEFRGFWRAQPSDANFLDPEGRLIDPARTAQIQRATAGQAGTITTATVEKKTESAPLPYSLADIQVEASRRLGLTAKEVLDVCQALYEEHRMTTYPRSDCRYLPEGHHQLAPAVTSAVATNLPALTHLVSQAELSRRSRAWNDSKVTAHHAIIPTSTLKPAQRLSERERGVYDLIVRRYLMQFFPAFEFNQAELEATIAGERFAAIGRQPIVQGWRVLLPGTTSAADQAEAEDADESKVDTMLPGFKQGDAATATDITVLDKKTTPPRRFTDDTLLQAMSGIARFVADPKIKQMLRETDGIGTPATQASIIQTLFERRYLEKKGRQILSTATGRGLIATLPTVATTPDMTALWEAAIRMIHDGERPLDDFVTAVVRQIEQLISRGKALGTLKLPGARPCPSPGCAGFLRRRNSPKGAFWGCSRYPDCSASQHDGNPAANRRVHSRAKGPRGRSSAA